MYDLPSVRCDDLLPSSLDNMNDLDAAIAALQGDDVVVEAEAALKLWLLAARNDHHTVAIREAGGIRLLVALLESRRHRLKLHHSKLIPTVSKALKQLAQNEENKVAIREAGGIPVFVALLSSSSIGTRQSAADALLTLSHLDAENKVAIREAGGVPPLLALVESSGPISSIPWPTDQRQNLHATAARALLSLSCDNDDNAVAIALARGRVEAFVELARRGRVVVCAEFFVENAGAAAKRKAALVVAALLRDFYKLAGRIPRYARPIIESYL